jgi:hypothetical protein
MGLHDDGKTGGTLNSWGQYAKSGNIYYDFSIVGFGRFIGSIKIISLTTWCLNGFFFKDVAFCCFCNSFSAVFIT